MRYPSLKLRSADKRWHIIINDVVNDVPGVGRRQLYEPLMTTTP